MDLLVKFNIHKFNSANWLTIYFKNKLFMYYSYLVYLFRRGDNLGIKRSSFSILFAIRESKARKSGKAPIEITITVNGERCTLSTGKQVPIDKWDKAKQQVKGKDEEAQSLNNYLKAIKAKLYQKEAELLDRGFIITAELLRDAYFDKVESLKEKSLFEVFAEHNKEQEKLVGNGVSKATYWISVYTVRLLKEFVQQKNLQN